MKRITILDTLLLAQRELRQFYNDNESEALLQLNKAIQGYNAAAEIVRTIQAIKKPWDDLVIEPVRIASSKGKKQEVEACEDKDADFYSIYVHYKEGGLECIFDVDTKLEAEKLVTLMNTMLRNYKS